MDKMKILVVEDEIIIADNICETLESLGYRALEPVLNFSEAIKSIEKHKPDLAILDIQLSGKKTGIDIAEKINSDYNFPFIFLSANVDANTINKAKKVSPNAYLVKPFTKNELFTSIEIAISNFSKNNVLKEKTVYNTSLFIKEKGRFSKVYFDSILYIKSDHVYIEIFCKNNKKMISRTSLNEISEKLNDSFQRIHRGYIVNLKYVDEINQNAVQIIDNTIPIGKKYKEDLLKKIASI